MGILIKKYCFFLIVVLLWVNTFVLSAQAGDDVTIEGDHIESAQEVVVDNNDNLTIESGTTLTRQQEIQSV